MNIAIVLFSIVSLMSFAQPSVASETTCVCQELAAGDMQILFKLSLIEVESSREVANLGIFQGDVLYGFFSNKNKIRERVRTECLDALAEYPQCQ